MFPKLARRLTLFQCKMVVFAKQELGERFEWAELTGLLTVFKLSPLKSNLAYAS